MFKIGSFEEELVSSMNKSLISNQLENKYSFDKISKAADYIGAAAELLDDTGFISQANALTTILQSLAAGKELEMVPEIIDETIPNQIIMEPLEQEIPVEPKKWTVKQEAPAGLFPLKVENPEKGKQEARIVEDKSVPPEEPLNKYDPNFWDDKFNSPTETPEYFDIKSIAQKIAKNKAKKKA